MMRVLTALALVGAVAGLAVVARAANQAPKNLQFLPKNIDPKELKDLMKAQAKALGVQCDHCHPGLAQADYATDTETKKTGRAMMKMTAQINAQFLGGKKMVTCATCHNGKPLPPNGGPDLDKEKARASAR